MGFDKWSAELKEVGEGLMPYVTAAESGLVLLQMQTITDNAVAEVDKIAGRLKTA